MLISAAALPWISFGFAAISLVVSLIVAFRGLVQRPKLDLVYERGTLRDIGKVRISTGSDYIKLANGEHYLRMRVVNRARVNRLFSQTATNVQVIASTTSSETRVGLDFRPLVWSSASPDPNEPVTALPIPVGVERHIDVAWLGEKPLSAGLLVWPEPEGGGDDLPDGEAVEVLLTLTCNETPATFWSVTVKRDDGADRRKRDDGADRRRLDFVGAPARRT